LRKLTFQLNRILSELLTSKNMRKYDTLLKFSKLRGKNLSLSFVDLSTKKEYHYSHRFDRMPTWEEQKEYIRKVFSDCGVSSTLCKPIA
jgi:hypothetical protein